MWGIYQSAFIPYRIHIGLWARTILHVGIVYAYVYTVGSTKHAVFVI